jgi:hypothetical protein
MCVSGAAGVGAPSCAIDVRSIGQCPTGAPTPAPTYVVVVVVFVVVVFVVVVILKRIYIAPRQLSRRR